MSRRWRLYCEEHGIDPNDRFEMKKFHLSRHATRRNEDGSINYLTEQQHKDFCDINHIIKKAPQRILNSRVLMHENMYLDVTGVDFQRSLNTVQDVKASFYELPSSVRKKFNNDPGKYLDMLAKSTPADQDIQKFMNSDDKMKKDVSSKKGGDDIVQKKEPKQKEPEA